MTAPFPTCKFTQLELSKSSASKLQGRALSDAPDDFPTTSGLRVNSTRHKLVPNHLAACWIHDEAHPAVSYHQRQPVLSNDLSATGLFARPLCDISQRAMDLVLPQRVERDHLLSDRLPKYHDCGSGHLHQKNRTRAHRLRAAGPEQTRQPFRP